MGHHCGITSRHASDAKNSAFDLRFWKIRVPLCYVYPENGGSSRHYTPQDKILNIHNRNNVEFQYNMYNYTV
jgi:hypothetical protein